jgi:hypothetical protein
VCGLTVILLLGGLGVQDKGLRQIPIWLQFLIGDCTKQETYRQKQSTLGEMNNKFEMLLVLFLLTFSEKKV